MQYQRGSLLKGFIIYLVVAFGLFVAIVEISKKIQSPIEATTIAFFDAVKGRHFSQAYSMLSKRARYELTHYDFHNFLKKYDFYDYKSSKWNTIDEHGDNAQISGHIILRDSTYVKIEMSLVRESTEKAVVRGQSVDFSKLPFSDRIKIWKIDKIKVS